MKYTKHAVNAQGWTDWIRPRLRGYRMKCCACGLLHEMDFRIVERGDTSVIQFRARRSSKK